MGTSPATSKSSGETLAGECPSFVVFHPSRPFAYAIDENNGVVRSFAVSARAELEEIGCVDSGGAGPQAAHRTHQLVERDGQRRLGFLAGVFDRVHDPGAGFFAGRRQAALGKGGLHGGRK